MKKHEYLSFEEARKEVRKLGLNDHKEWREYCRSGKNINNIRHHPEDYKEYIDVYDWLGTNREKRTHKVNDNFFKKWSHNMAYILGFWFADGHIMGKSIFSISQDTKDRYILEKISRIMRSNYPIYDGINNYGSRYSKMSIRSEKIVKDIIKLGGKERKSLDVKFPKIPKKYLPTL